MNREKKVVYNVSTNIIVQILLALSGLIIPRLILLKFGSNVNGLINSVSQFLTYAGLVELGIGNAAIVMLYKPIAEKNVAQISAIVSVARKKYLLSGLIYTGVICVLAMIYPLFVYSEFDYDFVFSIIIIIALTSIIDFLVIGKYKVLLYADAKYYIINLAKIVATVLLTVGSVGLLLNDRSIFSVKILAVITHIGEAVFIKLYVRKKYIGIDFYATESVHGIPQQINALIHQLTSVITYNTDMVVLTIFGTGNKLGEISVYSVYAMAFLVINNLMTCFTTGFDSVFGNIIASNKENNLRKIFKLYEYCYLVLLYALYASFAVLIVPFVKCYTQGVTDVDYVRLEVGILFAANGITASLKDPHGCIMKAYGNYKQTQKYVIAEACVNIVISIILVKGYGITGVLIGTLISHIIADIGLLSYTDRNLLNRRFWQSLKYNIVNWITVSLIILAELHIVNRIYDWKSWIMYAFEIVIINMLSLCVVNAFTDMESFRDCIITIKSKMKVYD